MPRKVTVKNMVDFFMRFIRNDQVGRICNAHLMIADASPVYAKDPRCEALAMLNSVAVDFGKTGIPVDNTAINNAIGNVEKPDFMDGGSKKSDTVIGRIYRDARDRHAREVSRRIERQGAALESMHGDCAWVGAAVPGSEELKKWAEEKLKEWTAEFSGMMASCAPLMHVNLCTVWCIFTGYSSIRVLLLV